MPNSVRVGQRLPPVALGELVHGEIRRVPLDALLAGRRTGIFGVPGAFTPICSQRHTPTFVSQAAALKKTGIDKVSCIGPNDPWTMFAWALWLRLLHIGRQPRFRASDRANRK